VLGAALATAAVVVTGFLVGSPSDPKADVSPAENPRLASATKYYGYGDRPELEPGTYALTVSPDPDGPIAVLDLPAGWHADRLGPNRGFDDDPGFVGVLVTEVYDALEEPCLPAEDGMRVLTADPDDLVSALVTMPRGRVLAGPETVEAFGHPATHLRVQAGNGHCPFGEPLWLTRSTGIGQPVPASPDHALSDVWVVDVPEGRPVLVSATWTPDTPRAAVQELHAVIDSLELIDPA
jgi:hypothetical protein